MDNASFHRPQVAQKEGGQKGERGKEGSQGQGERQKAHGGQYTPRKP